MLLITLLLATAVVIDRRELRPLDVDERSKIRTS